MALSATFTANFSNFYDAVKHAEKVLVDFGDRADRIGPRLKTLTTQFSGQRVVQEAALMAKAVEDIGGVSRLTEKELERLAGQAVEAVNKMKALGMDVPKNIQAIADKAKTANTATTDWLGTITKIASAVGIAFSIGTITNFIGEVLSAASAVKDLADQWGVSTKAVQQWTAAAKLSGVASETLGKSIQFMSQQLTDASKEYDALLANIGLSGEKLRDMSDEDAWREVIGALGKVTDEAARLDLGVGLLGPSFRKMTGAVGDDLLGLAAKQKFMTDETIKRLADAEAKWKSYYANLVIWGADWMAAFLKNIGTLTGSWGTFLGWAGATYKDFINLTRGSPTTLGPDFLKAKQAADDLATSTANLANSLKPVASHGAANNAVMETTAQVQARLKREEEGLKVATESRTKATADAARIEDVYNKSLADHEKSLNDLMNTFTGGGVIAKAELYRDALERSIPIEKMTRQEQEAINRVMTDAIAVYKAAGAAVPAELQKIADATAKVPAFTTPAMPNVNAKDVGSGAWSLPVSVDLTAPAAATKGYEAFAESIEDVTKAFSLLGNISDGVMDEVAARIATVTGAMNVADKSADTFKAGLANFKTGNLTQGFAQTAAGAAGVISAFQSATHETGKLQSTIAGASLGFSIAGPWGAAAGAVAGFVKGLWNARQEAKEVAKTRADFLTAAGGIDAMEQAASDANVSLTKLFAAKKKDDLTKALADIQEALEYQDRAMGTLAETTERYGFTIEQLGPALQAQELDRQAQGLFKDWEVLNAAGLDTVDITDNMSRAVSDYYNDAKRMGRDIPIEMKPMLEKFAEAGKLLDDNGDAIETLEGDGAHFTLTMSQGFQALIAEVEKLTNVISRSLSDAIEDVPDIEIDGYVNWDKSGHGPGTWTPPAVEPASMQHGSGGFKNFGTGTPAILHGWEAVVPRDQARAMLAGAAGGSAAAIAPTIVINAQGAFFDTPGDLQRLADKVGDALTAKYSVMGKLRAAV